MLLIMAMMTMAALISITLMVICFMVSKNGYADREKSSPFECGFDPMSSPRKPFSVHFFLIGILFLVFDVEIAIILPLIILMKIGPMWNWSFIMLSFLIILIAGLYHEWNNGALKWMT
uniref:NADH-ubiquinone oxidoreductase chain 3 n=1 Tax=Neuroctenus yunnanensis TaxID=2813420 RepID=A0A8T9VZM5_9HEMI|nr:NADH dehydrogenase subunit 3 [Neuroctenus yunnanensis]YP_010990156.1 NADH dehydrogenase subunit 3 [Neuroctenus taiwanicus]UPI55396.1 NADH dehydrogenase subunit 3 [Neuroctenus yunnanensis]WOW95752.1 NADH dehydrogenase subunit 3 [Neuroctenus taiwanicus]